MVNGIVVVYKEKGFTSFDVVAKMRGIFHQKKIGHTGTLDPDAEGVLPVCLGRATKVCDLLTDRDKVYETVLLLGRETDTQDITGTVLREHAVDVDEEQIREVIHSFEGKYEQIPPMYSALKVNGQKLCDLARRGVTVERASRPVFIYQIEILSISLPEVRMRVHCSKGTYIRTLCQDIGEKLGCLGCMKSLLRTKAAGFTLEEAIRLSDLALYMDSLTEEERQQKLPFVHSVDSVFTDLPAAVVSQDGEKLMANGNRLPLPLVRMLPDTADADNDSGAGAGDRQQKVPVECNFRLYRWDGVFAGVYILPEGMDTVKPVKLFLE